MADDAPEATAGSITVAGTGRVSIEPDRADLRLGIAVARPTVAAARSDAAAIMDRIRAALDKVGIAARDIRTTQLTVQPRYDYVDGRSPALSGYELGNVVEVTIRDLVRLAEVVDGSLQAGATSMDSLSFRREDPAEAERQARILAMRSARARADVLAEAGGLTIVGVSAVAEGAALPERGPQAKAERMLMSADMATPVSGGSLDIEVTVTVRYRTT